MGIYGKPKPLLSEHWTNLLEQNMSYWVRYRYEVRKGRFHGEVMIGVEISTTKIIPLCRRMKALFRTTKLALCRGVRGRK